MSNRTESNGRANPEVNEKPVRRRYVSARSFACASGFYRFPEEKRASATSKSKRGRAAIHGLGIAPRARGRVHHPG